jgi:hypothetical protein
VIVMKNVETCMTTTGSIYRHSSPGVFSVALALLAMGLASLPAPVAAQEAEPAPTSGAAPAEGAAPEEQMAPEEIDQTIEKAAAIDIEAGLEDLPENGDKQEGEPDNSWGFLLAGKVGGMVPFSDLGVMATGALELGVVFGGTEQRIAALLDVSYTVPTADGKGDDSRMQAPGMEDDGIYSWELTQKELSFQPTFVFRFTGLAEPFVPYAGIGPRIYLLESVVEGRAGESKIPENVEQSTGFGFGVPLGCEFELGPGGLLAELLFQWGPLTHDITGDSNLGSASLWLGYRAIL